MNKDGTDNFLPLVDGVRKIQNGLFAFHMETPVGYRLVAKYFSEHEKCDLREIPFANIRSPEIVTRKHSHFKEIIRIMYEYLPCCVFYLYNNLLIPIISHYLVPFASRRMECRGNCGRKCMSRSQSVRNRVISCHWL